MSSYARILSASLCLALLLPALSGFAATANLTATADTFINSNSPGNNAGGTGWIDAGRDGVGGIRRGLLRFDLSGIPTGSTVTAATLRLTVVRVPSTSPVNSTFDLFRLLANWTEGTKTGNSGARDGRRSNVECPDARHGQLDGARRQERCGGRRERLDGRNGRGQRDVFLERRQPDGGRAALGEQRIPEFRLAAGLAGRELAALGSRFRIERGRRQCPHACDRIHAAHRRRRRLRYPSPVPPTAPRSPSRSWCRSRQRPPTVMEPWRRWSSSTAQTPSGSTLPPPMR